MTLIALLAAGEAMLFSATHTKLIGARRQQVLMGNTLGSTWAGPYDALSKKPACAGRRPVDI